MYRGQVKDVSMYRGSLCPLWSGVSPQGTSWRNMVLCPLKRGYPLLRGVSLSTAGKWTFWSLSEVPLYNYNNPLCNREQNSPSDGSKVGC